MEVSFTTSCSVRLPHSQHRYPTNDLQLAPSDPDLHPDQLIVSIDDENEEELALSPNNDSPSILARNEQHTARLHDSKVAAYLLRPYLAVLALVCLKLIHDGIANPFMVISIIAFGVAYLILSILSWIYEHSEDSHNYYNKILKGVYYILCNLAFFSLLPLLFTTG
ncbi:hypothetical protein L1987_29186 [Smallanthus sonchifolius]|uniref:Uncharacterized protein n=1 Tax=Smallanthus sonchifolius TaxID=185202 RepID=A0ACB9I0R8_9ASTR|nr:hypothetical protein L1987_29186 [Smallanthus sonchifolius]